MLGSVNLTTCTRTRKKTQQITGQQLRENQVRAPLPPVSASFIGWLTQTLSLDGTLKPFQRIPHSNFVQDMLAQTLSKTGSLKLCLRLAHSNSV